MSVTTTQDRDVRAVARELAEEFVKTAAERDAQGGNPKAERDQIRESGLLLLRVPKAFGGLGEDWHTVLQVVRIIAEADASLAHVFGYHHLQVVTPHLLGTVEQRNRYYEGTVRHGWFWANALNPRDRRLLLTGRDGSYRLNGVKSYCSGSKDSDVLVISAWDPAKEKTVVAVVPTNREGIVLRGDWDNMGQRQTDSGTVEFHDVRVENEEILSSPGPHGTPFASLRSCLTQIILTNLFVGIAAGALKEAAAYTRRFTRAWDKAGVREATEDPYILHHYGTMWIALQGAEALADRAGDILEQAWGRQEALTADERGECAVAVAAAKAAAARAALDITSRIFEVTGSGATSSRLRYDRFWRNVRTMTLHDPVDYKIYDVGQWVLNGRFPAPEFYS